MKSRKKPIHPSSAGADNQDAELEFFPLLGDLLLHAASQLKPDDQVDLEAMRTAFITTARILLYPKMGLQDRFLVEVNGQNRSFKLDVQSVQGEIALEISDFSSPSRQYFHRISTGCSPGVVIGVLALEHVADLLLKEGGSMHIKFFEA